MTKAEKCEAILKRIMEVVERSGEKFVFEYDFGDYTGTIYDDKWHTHVGVPGEKTEENWNIFVDNLYNVLHGGQGLSWHKED